MDALLKGTRCPYCAAVALEPFTGRVLAMSEHASARPSLRGLTVRAVFPAASVFKIITTSSLGPKPHQHMQMWRQLQGAAERLPASACPLT